MCDKYEKYVEDNHLKNSEAESAIRYIRKVYDHCLESGDFCLGGKLMSALLIGLMIVLGLPMLLIGIWFINSYAPGT